MPSSSVAWLSVKRPLAASAPARREQQLDPLRSRARLAAAGAARRRTSGRRSQAPAARPPRPPRATRPPRRRRPRAPHLDMVRARRRGRAALRQRRSGPLVSAQPPAAGRRLIDRAAHERMTEAEPPRNVRRADQVQREQIIERVDRGLLATPAAAAARSGSNGSPATAAPSSTRRAPSGNRPSSSANAAPRSPAPRRRRARGRAQRAHGRSRLAGAGELLQIERVAAALPVQDRRFVTLDCITEQPTGLAARERHQLEANQRLGPVRPLDRRRQALVGLQWTRRQRDQHRRRRRPVAKRLEGFRRARRQVNAVHDGESVVLRPQLAVDVAGLRGRHVDLRHVPVEFRGISRTSNFSVWGRTWRHPPGTSCRSRASRPVALQAELSGREAGLVHGNAELGDRSGPGNPSCRWPARRSSIPDRAPAIQDHVVRLNRPARKVVLGDDDLRALASRPGRVLSV